MKKNITISTSLVIIVLLSSFLPKDKSINDLPKTIRKTYSFVPAGKVFFDQDSTEVTSFYILQTEVDNKAYREFISDLKKNGKQQELAIANVDSEKWAGAFAYNAPYVSYYFNYPAYNGYPVVNVSYDGAMLYCKWLAEKLNQMYNHSFYYEVRLPSRKEWIRAAQLDERNFVYTWGGPYLSNRQGMALCNYRRVGDESIHSGSTRRSYSVVNTDVLNDNADVTAPVNSFYPNIVGLYNMNGNVAEMVAEKGIAVGGSWNSTGYDVRNESTMNYTGPAPFIGFRPVLIIKKK